MASRKLGGAPTLRVCRGHSPGTAYLKVVNGWIRLAGVWHFTGQELKNLCGGLWKLCQWLHGSYPSCESSPKDSKDSLCIIRSFKVQLSGKVVRKRSYCVRAMGLDLTVLIRGIDGKIRWIRIQSLPRHCLHCNTRMIYRIFLSVP